MPRHCLPEEEGIEAKGVGGEANSTACAGGELARSASLGIAKSWYHLTICCEQTVKMPDGPAGQSTSGKAGSAAAGRFHAASAGKGNPTPRPFGRPPGD